MWKTTTPAPLPDHVLMMILAVAHGEDGKMTISEFKAWLDGFSHAIGDAPTPEQWAEIKAKIETLSVTFVPPTYPIKRMPGGEAEPLSLPPYSIMSGGNYSGSWKPEVDQTALSEILPRKPQIKD